MRNVGAEFIEALYEVLQIDEEWSIRDAKGFTWWPAWLKQRVWFEGPFDTPEFPVWRIHIRTDVCAGFVPTTEQSDYIKSLLMMASMSGIIRDPLDNSRLQFAATVVVNQQDFDSLLRLATAIAAIQAEEAHRNSYEMSERGIAESGATAHPSTGPRTEPDELLNIIENYFRPAGEDPSRAQGTFEAARIALRGLDVHANVDVEGLDCEIAVADSSCLITMSSTQQHPLFGTGLLTAARSPLQSDDILLPISLNEESLANPILLSQLGTWALDPERLARVVFYPNVLCSSELTSSSVLSAIRIFQNGLGELRAAATVDR